MKKSPQRTTNRKIANKKVTKDIVSDNRTTDTRNAFLQLGTWRIVPLTKQSAERLAITLMDWCLHETEPLCLDEFLIKHRLHRKTYYSWVDKFEELERVHGFAMMTLGARREVGGLRNELNAALVKFTLPLYNEEHKALVEWYNQAKADQETLLAASKIVVNMSKFPESDLVPYKVKDEDGR